MSKILGIDIGGTKIAYGLLNSEGELRDEGHFATPLTLEKLLAELRKIIEKVSPEVVGVTIPGTIDARNQVITEAPNLPYLRGVSLLKKLELTVPAVMDNDARAALIAEAWKGAASEVTSAVLITLGTGVGGAVMQKGVVLPHPRDISQEISHIKANSFDPFMAVAGSGTIEALLGKKNLERRFEIPLTEVVAGARKGNSEMLEITEVIRGFLTDAIRAIHQTYNCKMIVIGGGGSEHLDLYLEENENSYPCTVKKAVFGVKAGVVGAAKLASEIWLSREKEREEWEGE